MSLFDTFSALYLISEVSLALQSVTEVLIRVTELGVNLGNSALSRLHCLNAAPPQLDVLVGGKILRQVDTVSSRNTNRIKNLIGIRFTSGTNNLQFAPYKHWVGSNSGVL